MTIELFIKYLKIILKIRLEYRFDFILGAIGQIVGYGANYLVVWILLQEFKVIDGWVWSEITLLISLNLLTYAIGATFTYTPMTSLGNLIVNGEFDKFLTKPINPLLNLMASFFNYGYIAHIIISSSILSWSLLQPAIQWNIYKVVYLLLIIISGSFLQGGFLIVIGCWSFKFLRINFLFRLYSNMKGFLDYPLSIYNGFIQSILTGVIPLAFINYYPTLYLLDKNKSFLIWLSPFIGPFIFIIALKIWNVGISHYEGAGN